MEKYDLYDQVIHATISNIYTVCGSCKEIIVDDLNFSDENDLLFFEIMKMASNVFGFSITIRNDLFRNIWLKFFKRIKAVNIKNYKKNATIKIDILKQCVAPLMEMMPEVTFSDIYNDYYNERNK